MKYLYIFLVLHAQKVGKTDRELRGNMMKTVFLVHPLGCSDSMKQFKVIFWWVMLSTPGCLSCFYILWLMIFVLILYPATFPRFVSCGSLLSVILFPCREKHVIYKVSNLYPLHSSPLPNGPG